MVSDLVKEVLKKSGQANDQFSFAQISEKQSAVPECTPSFLFKDAQE